MKIIRNEKDFRRYEAEDDWTSASEINELMLDSLRAAWAEKDRYKAGLEVAVRDIHIRNCIGKDHSFTCTRATKALSESSE